MKAPCLNCKNRSICCHDTCDKYRKYKQIKEKAKTNKEDMNYGNYLFDAIGRMQTIRVRK